MRKINFNAKKMGVLVQTATKHFQLLYSTGIWKANPAINTSTEWSHTLLVQKGHRVQDKERYRKNKM